MNPWVTVWATALHGRYPHGTPVAQPDLSAALPDPAQGLRDQAVRMVVHPAALGRQARVRLSHRFGDRPLTLDRLSLGLAWAGGAVRPGSSRTLRVRGQTAVTLDPGHSCWTDPVTLDGVWSTPADGAAVAISLRVCGASGALSWHSKAMGTSYLGWPGGGAAAGDEAGSDLPFATTSWFVVDALDMALPAGACCVVCLGDSLTDGTGTTLNGRDRWVDHVQRRLSGRPGADASPVCVINAGIGGNRVAGLPAPDDLAQHWRRGPPAVQRLQADVLSLSGVHTVIWLEGINDLSEACGADADAVIAGWREGAAVLRAAGIRVLGATIPSALGSDVAGHGGDRQDRERRRANDWLRGQAVPQQVFDGVIDMDAALTDPVSGAMRCAFRPDSTLGGPGDGVHPNRAGHLAMAAAVDLRLLPGHRARAV